MSQQHPQFQQPFQPAPQPPKKSHTVRNVVIGVVVGIFLVIGGCTAIIGGALSSVDKDKPTGITEAGSSTTPDTGPSPEPVITPTNQYTPTETVPPEEPAKDTTTIGKTLTYESGLAVRVVSAKVFNPSYASGLTAGHRAVKVTWTITNGTDANVDLTGASARLTYGTDGTQAESVYADGVGGEYPFDGSLRPGQKKTATSAFSVPKAGLSAVTVEVEPEFMSETAFFTGSAK